MIRNYRIKNEYLDETVEFETMEETMDYIYGEEIIYYSKAMNYLIENDCSLQESLELCEEMGIEIKDITSEVLATVHYQMVLMKAVSDISEN